MPRGHYVRKTKLNLSGVQPLTPTASVTINSDELIQHAKTVMDRAIDVVVANGSITFNIGKGRAA